MKLALYARVSTESEEIRGTIGSQLAALRERVATEGQELVAEFCHDGYSGARLDRPGVLRQNLKPERIDDGNSLTCQLRVCGGTDGDRNILGGITWMKNVRA